MQNKKIQWDLDAWEDYLYWQKQEKEDVAGKKVLSVNEKYYVVDHGIREEVYGNNERDINQVLENIICIELQKS